MGTISRPETPAPGKRGSRGVPVVLVLAFFALLAVGVNGYLKSRTKAPTAPRAEASQGVVPAPLEDVASARNVLDGYLKAASTSDAQKLLEFSGVET
ncbi:MAG: hypothetical protein PHS14_20620, partial [Elusimicrobia bacterium]|nr:hypothetical protein [Elusimicrobiota bacterium]